MDRQLIRVWLSYARLFVATCLFMGGLACLFGQSPAAAQRIAHWRESQLRTMPQSQIEAWIAYQDTVDAQGYAYLRVFGVVLGGVGLAMALRETAYLHARYAR